MHSIVEIVLKVETTIWKMGMEDETKLQYTVFVIAMLLVGGVLITMAYFVNYIDAFE